MKNTDILNGYSDHLVIERRMSENTLEQYMRIINKFISFNSKDLQETTREDIKDFIRYLMTAELKNSTISNHVIGLRSFFNYLADKTQRKEIMSLTFFLQRILKIKRERSVRQVPNNQEWERLRDAAQAYKVAASYNKESKLYKNTLRDYAIFETIVATSGRVSEISNIRLCDIDFNSKTIFMRSRKGGHQGMVIFGEKAKIAIQELVNIKNLSSHDKLFGITYESQIYYIIKKWVKKAGVNNLLHPHSFRHFHITEAQRNGASLIHVAEQADHKNLNTTRGYTHFDLQDRRESYAKFFS